MSISEAKEILLRVRSLDLDGNEPEVKEALDLCKNHPDLSVWLAEYRNFHNTVAIAMRKTDVPADLRQRLLAASPKIVPFWQKPIFLAMAASLILILALGGWRLSRPKEDHSYAGFKDRMLGFALREYRMDVTNSDQAAVRQFLAHNYAPADFILPGKLASTPLKGGAKLKWQGDPVAMMCFAGPQNQTLYLFVADENAFSEKPQIETRFEKFHQLSTVEWDDQGLVFVLAAQLDRKSLGQLLL